MDAANATQWSVVEVRPPDAKPAEPKVYTLEDVVKSQAALAQSMQQLLTAVNTKLELLSCGLRTLATHAESGNVNTRMLKAEIEQLQSMMTALEDKVVEKSVRDVNKKLRLHRPFEFNSQKNPY